MNSLRDSLGNLDCVKEVRGKGMMIGVELDRPATELRAIGQERGLIFNVTAQSVIRMVPPLILDKPEIDHAVSSLTEMLKEWA